jgi:hypothetical protein
MDYLLSYVAKAKTYLPWETCMYSEDASIRNIHEKKVGWEGAWLGDRGGVSSLEDDGKDVEDVRG